VFNFSPRWRHRKIPWCTPISDLFFLVPVLYGLAIDHRRSGHWQYGIYPLCIHFCTAKRFQLNPVHNYIGGFGGRKNKNWTDRLCPQRWFCAMTKLRRKNSPNTTHPGPCIFLHVPPILIIGLLTCLCTLECRLGLYFLVHSPWPDLYFRNTSPECLFFFHRHRARNNIQTRPPVPDELLNF